MKTNRANMLLTLLVLLGTTITAQAWDRGEIERFVHISAVERAGMRSLNEGQKVRYDVVSERGKLAAANLQNV